MGDNLWGDDQEDVVVVSLLDATGLIEEVHKAYPLDLENIHYNYAKEWNKGMKEDEGDNDEYWMSAHNLLQIDSYLPSIHKINNIYD